MAAPSIRGVTQAALSDSGTATSPAGTQVGDLVLVWVWSQGTNIPTHTIQSGFTTVRSHSHNDGTTDGRLSVGAMVATAAGAQSYQPFAVSGATAGQTCAGCVVLTAGTWLDLDLDRLFWKQNSTTSTGTGAPNPPSVTGLYADWLVLTSSAWHVTTAASTTTTQPANYTEQLDGPTGSHVTHLAVSSRALTGLSNATEDPGAYTDNVTPNGTASLTIAIPGTNVPPLWLAGAADGTLPTGALPGDLLIANVYRSGADPGTYTGWTKIGGTLTVGSFQCAFFYRIWQAGDSMPSWVDGANIEAFRGANPSSPVGDFDSSAQSGTSLTLNSITASPGGGDSAVVFIITASAVSYTPAANYVERVDGADGLTIEERPGLTASQSTSGTVTASASDDYAVLHAIVHALANAEGTVYDETGRAITALALVALTDLQRYAELGASVAAVAVATTADAQHYRDLGLAVPLNAVVSAAEAQHYLDTGLAIPVTGAVSVVDAKKFKELGLAATVVGLVSEIDRQDFVDAGLAVTAEGQVTLTEALHAVELGLPVVIVGTASAADAQRYREAALAVSLASAVTIAAEQQHKSEALEVTAQAQLALTDLQHYRDLAVDVPVSAVMNVTDTVQGSTPLESLSVVVVGSASASELAHRLEASLPVEAQAVLSSTDAQHYRDELAALLAVTVTAPDAQQYREALEDLAQGGVVVADVQRYLEVGLLAGGQAVVTVTDELLSARPGTPLYAFATPAWQRAFVTPPWQRQHRTPAWQRAFVTPPWQRQHRTPAWPRAFTS